jgi:transposase
LLGVEILRQVWLQQYWTEVHEDGRSQVHARSEDNQPPCEKRLQSPYDLEARFSIKRKTEWMGYKTHLTETCEKDEIHLITHVETTLATTQDVDLTASIHTALKEKALLPDEHLVDGGYVDAENLVAAKQTFGLELCGPVKKDVRWQAQAGEGFDLSHFQVDWSAKRVTCPSGQTSQSWYEQVNAYLHPVIQVRFAPATCRACAQQAKCTRDKQGRRTLILLPQAEHLAIQQRRVEQETPAFRETYAQRSGIEGTLSQGIRGFEMRRSRYVGLAKTHLQMLATATAINLHRLFDWWQDKPRATTRVSPFAGLAPAGLTPVGNWGSA